METETNIENQPPKSSNKAAYIILALVLILAAVLLWKSSGVKNRDKLFKPGKIQVPSEFVLSSNAQKNYDEQQNLEVVRFTSEKSKQELIDFYTNKLKREGWTIKNNQQISEKSYVIYATRPENRINVFILSTEDPKQFEVEVTYLTGLK